VAVSADGSATDDVESSVSENVAMEFEDDVASFGCCP
jgi:hypothetical protein